MNKNYVLHRQDFFLKNVLPWPAVRTYPINVNAWFEAGQNSMGIGFRDRVSTVQSSQHTLIVRLHVKLCLMLYNYDSLYSFCPKAVDELHLN